MRIAGGSKTLGKFPTFEKCDRKRDLTQKFLKESRVATTGVEGLGSQSSNL